MFGDVSNKQRKGHCFSCRHKKRKKGWGGVSEHQEKEEEEEEGWVNVEALMPARVCAYMEAV